MIVFKREGENQLIQTHHGELPLDIRVKADKSKTHQFLHPQLTFSLISTAISP